MRHLFVLVLFCFLCCVSESQAARIVERNETWTGKITVTGDVIVRPGSTLTLSPGTEVRLSRGGTFSVEGRLLAKGTAENPVVIGSAAGSKPGSWQGLSFHQGTKEGSDLEQVRIDGAVQALSVVGSKVRIVSSTLQGGNKAIISGGGAYIAVERVTVSNMSEGGIDASVGSQGTIIGCTIRRVTGFGIQAGKQVALTIRDNKISDAKFGILVSGSFPPLENNTVERCEVGIAIFQANPDTIIRGNKVSKAKTGIACQQFSSPTLERNSVEESEKAIECFQASSPIIRQNRFARNRYGLYCVQMCNPRVTRNDFVDNGTAAYLHLSSYAQFQENNFERNRLHIELDNMSYDWEVRANKKPTRNRQAQNEVLTQRGRAMPEEFRVEVESEGFVNAKENYWGSETTKEMEAKGLAANITSISDAFDVPTRTYEGWPGSYKQDRVRYDGWKKQRIPKTGP